MIIFDVETVPDFDLDAQIVASVREKHDKIPANIKDENIIMQRSAANSIKVIKDMSTDPMLAKPVVIGMLLDCSENRFEIGSYKTISGDECEMLKEFWEIVGKSLDGKTSPLVITFNGKQFDVPLIMARSALNGIRPSIEIPIKKWDMFPHADMMEILSCKYGTYRSLDFYCRYFKIASPKNDFDGSMVYETYVHGGEAGMQMIKNYVINDCVALYKLFLATKDVYYKPVSSRNSGLGVY